MDSIKPSVQVLLDKKQQVQVAGVQTFIKHAQIGEQTPDHV